MTGITSRARPRSAVAPRWVSAAVFLLAAAIGLAAQALATTGQPTHAVVWGSLSSAVYAAGLLCLLGGGQGNSSGWAGGGSAPGSCSGTAPLSGWPR